MTQQQQVEFGRYARRWERLHANLPVRVLVKAPDCLRIVSGRGSALSEGGMAVYAPVELGIGDHVNVELPAPDSGPPLRLTAAVQNRAGYLYGLAFEFGTGGE